MVNPIGHWIWVPFCTRSCIPLRMLSRSWGIRFRIPLRGLSGFRVPLGLVVPANQSPSQWMNSGTQMSSHQTFKILPHNSICQVWLLRMNIWSPIFNTILYSLFFKTSYSKSTIKPTESDNIIM